MYHCHHDAAQRGNLNTPVHDVHFLWLGWPERRVRRQAAPDPARFSVFRLRQFFSTIPKDLDEAAKIDGAGRFRIFVQIMLPLIKPALVVVALFSFINCWNEFFYTLIYLQGEKSYTLSLGLYMVNGIRLSNFEQVMALAVIVTLPCLVFFLIGNKYLVEGITLTGIKG